MAGPDSSVPQDSWRIPLPGSPDPGEREAPQLSAYVTEPEGEPRAVLVIWPALGAPASYYAPFCAELAARGIAVVAVDQRGQGANRPRPGRGSRYGYHELATRDWPAVLAAVRERFGDGVPLYPLGHSIGGHLSVMYAAQDPKGVDGLLLVASGSVDFRGYPGPAGPWVLARTQLVTLITTVWGYWPGHRLGFAGRQPARLMRDWGRISRTGRFAPAGADVDYEARFGEVRLPVLAVSVAGDRLAPAGAVDRLCAKLPSASVERWHYPATGTSADHIRWVRSGADIAERISEWLEKPKTV
jgi:predicted alpha/beta hydrolase